MARAAQPTDTALRAARRQRRLTLQEVADAVGTDTGNLSRIERGDQVPGDRLSKKLEAFYGGEVSETQIITASLQPMAEASGMGSSPHQNGVQPGA